MTKQSGINHRQTPIKLSGKAWAPAVSCPGVPKIWCGRQPPASRSPMRQDRVKPRPIFKIARVLRVPAQKSRPLIPPPGHSRVSGSLPLQARAFGSAFASVSSSLGLKDARRFALRFHAGGSAYSPKPSQITVTDELLRDKLLESLALPRGLEPCFRRERAKVGRTPAVGEFA
jgi:hypothetical protein